MSDQTSLIDNSLLDYVPEVTPGETPAETVFLPPKDGPATVKLFLREQTDPAKPTVYPKATPSGGVKVLAQVYGRIVKPDGSLGAYIKDAYPSTESDKYSGIEPLTYIMDLAGSPLKAGMSIKAIMAHVQQVFSEHSVDGINVPVYLRWNKSVKDPQTGEYVETRGMQAIIAKHQEWVAQSATGFEDETERTKFVEYWLARPHKFLSDDGTEREIRLEISRYLPA